MIASLRILPSLFSRVLVTHGMLACLFAVIMFGISVPPIVHATACDAIIGKWAWFIGGHPKDCGFCRIFASIESCASGLVDRAIDMGAKSLLVSWRS